VWTDDDRFVDDDYYYGLGLGKAVGESWNVEFNGITGKYDPTVGGASTICSSLSYCGLTLVSSASVGRRPCHLSQAVGPCSRSLRGRESHPRHQKRLQAQPCTLVCDHPRCLFIYELATIDTAHAGSRGV
jgi:hypothetical protein